MGSVGRRSESRAEVKRENLLTEREVAEVQLFVGLEEAADFVEAIEKLWGVGYIKAKRVNGRLCVGISFKGYVLHRGLLRVPWQFVAYCYHVLGHRLKGCGSK